MFHRVMLVLPLFLLALTAVGWADDETDKEKLQGRWVMTNISSKGKSLPLPEGKKVVLTFFKDGKLISEGGEKGKLEGTYTIDSSKKPKQIDLVEKKDDTPGVYVFEGETLKIGMPLLVKKDADEKVGPVRPTAIEGDNVITITLKREGK